jgi:hypothetical protein
MGIFHRRRFRCDRLADDLNFSDVWSYFRQRRHRLLVGGAVAVAVAGSRKSARRASLAGQPLRIKYFQKALAHMKALGRVWFATGSEIAEAYESVCG